MKHSFYIIVLVFVTCLNASCGNPKKEDNKYSNMKVVLPLPKGQIYKDRDGNEWNRDNLFAPRENESLNDDSYQRRNNMGKYAPEESQYDRGYKKGYKDARRRYE